MKKNYIFLLSIFLLSSCNFDLIISNGENDTIESKEQNTFSEESITSIEDNSSIEETISNVEELSSSEEIISSEEEISSIEEDSSYEENSLEEQSSSIIEDSSSIEEDFSSEEASSENTSSTLGSNQYRDNVDRNSIHYSSKLQNDPNHTVRQLEVFELNDTHGAYYEENDGDISVARAFTCIKEYTNDPYATLKIANGDMMQGSAFSNMLLGEPAVAALNEMAFDCYVIGNHEFDWGLDVLSIYKDNDPSNGELDCPFLCANLANKSKDVPDWIEPYTVVNKGDLKVGIIGIIGDGLENQISKVYIGDYYFTDTVAAVNKYCDILLNQEHVDSIIVSSHDHVIETNQRYVDNNKIDAIINGHDHTSVEEYVTRYDSKRIPVIESNTKNTRNGLGKLTLNYDDNKQFNSYSIRHFNYLQDYELDENLADILDIYHDVIKDYQSEIIGYNPSYLDKEGVARKTANYLATYYDCDLVILNRGGIRSTLPKGDVTIGKIYEIYPFDNELVIAELKGYELKNILDDEHIEMNYFNNIRGCAEDDGTPGPVSVGEG